MIPFAEKSHLPLTSASKPIIISTPEPGVDSLVFLHKSLDAFSAVKEVPVGRVLSYSEKPVLQKCFIVDTML